jgi:cyclopropane fatty-acyl-phospholipid synthase-like methyltransferase
MVEAVGHEHLPAYFSAISSVLKPGGKAIIQVIKRQTCPCPFLAVPVTIDQAGSHNVKAPFCVGGRQGISYMP